MRKDDAIRVTHMVDAAREALNFVGTKTRDSFINDRMLLLSVIKEIEIIGEAAAKISEETRTACPTIPWEDIVGMRNHLVHGYFDVDVDIVWDTATNELPKLLRSLELLIDT